MSAVVFFFNDTATTEIYTLSLHDALPIYLLYDRPEGCTQIELSRLLIMHRSNVTGDRKSTRLNSSHDQISYAVFCLKKKKHAATHGGCSLATGPVQALQAAKPAHDAIE